MPSSINWRVRDSVKGIPDGTILTQIPEMKAKSSIQSTLSVLRRNAPNNRFVVCNHDGKQIILKVGRDIIPHSVGVSDRK
tara:strand:+ start:2188 stop:2427 length:240 start_codon:yes stop_codon:yes gene_type:complete